MRYIAVLAVLALSATFPSTSAARQWTNSSSQDEMTGQKRAHAHSAQVSSAQPMPFPYSGVKAWLGFGCDATGEWAYIGFSEEPNLIRAEPISTGYSRLRTRVRWDDAVMETQMTQQWGSRFLHFRDRADAISRMMRANSLRVELEWYGAGRVYFDFSLAGSSAAIARARSMCQGRSD